MSEPNPSSEHCQRWEHCRHTWRHRREGGFDATPYRVAPLPESIARPFVTGHHYSASWPAARLSYGLFDTRAELDDAHPTDAATGELLVGVAVFVVPMSVRALTNVFPDLTLRRRDHT